MQLAGATLLITGSNRGVGRALVEAALDRGAEKVYAAARDVSALDPVLGLAPDRVVPVPLELRDTAGIDAAVARATDARIFINNAAVARFGPALDTPRESVLDELLTNAMGTFDVIRAVVPQLEAAGGGAIVNVMSLQSFAGSAGMDGYSASKAAMHSLTQSLRPVLAAKGIALSGVYPGGIDTDMLRGIDAPKSSPMTVACGILDGLEAGEEDIFPDPVARYLGRIYQDDPKHYERLFSHTEELVATLDRARDDGILTLP